MERKTNVHALPKHIEEICNRLEEAGFASYAVGGCVRDMVRGVEPHDYDVATAALPETVKSIFPRTVDTGINHGTVTVLLPEEAVEVTTFRRDGQYTDSRHPDEVAFVSEIESDLARRDFTVNAMAYSPQRGFCDPYGGRTDLEKKLLRTVGKAEVRFSEDALRILRLYRFAAQLSFEMETETEEAARSLSGTLLKVSRERVFAELSKLLRYATAADLKRTEVIFKTVMPGISFSDTQYEKTANCPDVAGKWAHLCKTAVADVLHALRAPRWLILSAGELAAYKKGVHIVADVNALRHTAPETLFSYLFDAEAEKEWAAARESGAPMCIQDLAVSGEDLKAAGFYGKEIGEALERLFMYAIENPANNKKEILMEVATWISRKKH